MTGTSSGMVNLYLVDPSDQLSYQFATLRNELKNNDIRYEYLIGLPSIRQLLGDRDNRNLIVINSSKLQPSDIPKEYINADGNEIYMYPKPVGQYAVLPTPMQVVDLYDAKLSKMNSYRQIAPLKNISMRSIRKDLQRSKQKKTKQQLYDNVLLMRPKGGNPQYDSLFNVLQAYQIVNKKIQVIAGENEIQQYRDGKSLLVIESAGLRSVENFIRDIRYDSNVDLAVFGYVKEFFKKKNAAVTTDRPEEIVKYIELSGIKLPNIGSKLTDYKKVNSGDDYKIFTFGRKGEDPLMTSLQAQNAKNQTFTQQQSKNKSKQTPSKEIPLISKYTEAEGVKKTAKKVKKHNSSNNSSVININASEDGGNRVGSDTSERVSLANELELDEKLNPATTVPINSRPPLPQINVPNILVSNVIPPASMEVDKITESIMFNQNIFKAPLNEVNNVQENKEIKAKKIKAKMHWNIRPDPSKISPNFQGPLFTLTKQGEAPIKTQLENAAKHYSGSERMDIDADPLTQSKQLVTYNNSLLQPKYANNEHQERLQLKYKNGQIRELSEQYKGSNLSFPVEDNRGSMGFSTSSQNPRISSQRPFKSDSSTDINFYSQHRPAAPAAQDSQSIRLRKNSAPVLKQARTPLQTMPIIVQQSASHNNSTNQQAPSRVQPVRVITHSVSRPEVYYQQAGDGVQTGDGYQMRKREMGEVVTGGERGGSTRGSAAGTVMETATIVSDYNSRGSNLAGGSGDSYRYGQPTTSQYRRQSTTTQVEARPSGAGFTANIRNYMASLGISQDRYEIITDANGKTVYKLKAQPTTTTTTTTTTTLNKTSNYVAPDTPTFDTPTVNRPIANMAIHTTTTPLTTTPLTTTTQTLTRYKSQPKYQPANSPRSSTFNWQDYDQHTDERGRKYYTLKKSSSSTSVTGGQVLGLNSRTSSRLEGLDARGISNNGHSADRNYGSNDASTRVANGYGQANGYNYGTGYNVSDAGYSGSNYSTSNGYGTITNSNTYGDNINKIYTNKYTDRYTTAINNDQYYSPTIDRLHTLDNNTSPTSIQKSTTTITTTDYHTHTPQVLIRQTYEHTHQPMLTNKYQQLTHYNSASNRPSIVARAQQSGATYTRSSQMYSNTAHNSHNAHNDDTSGASRDSLLTDSRHPSLSKIANGHLYGDNKYYTSTGGSVRVDTQEDLAKVQADLRMLDVRGNFVHFVVDTGHGLRHEIEGMADVHDTIAEATHPTRIYECIEKRPLPNDTYDIGLVFVGPYTQINPGMLTDGYYLVDINPTNPLLQIRKQRRTIALRNLDNLPLAKKLILGSQMQYYIFYPRNPDPDISRTLNLFPAAKFQKYTYGSRAELENLVSLHLKNKGRFGRTLIFVTLGQIAEIQSVMDSNLNNRTFTMICCSREAEAAMRGMYPRVVFPGGLDFQSYGSVMNLSSQDLHHEQLPEGERYTISRHYDTIESSSKLNKPIIYIQRPHAGIDKQIERNYPNQYQIKYFNSPGEIKDKSRDNFVLLHREADNIGHNFDRNAGTVIMLGGQRGDRIPNGSVNIGTLAELINNIL